MCMTGNRKSMSVIFVWRMVKGLNKIEEIEKIIIKEKGRSFWEDFVRKIEKNQRENFIDGYKYAIRILEDGLTRED